jgi:hypothetical protein
MRPPTLMAADRGTEVDVGMEAGTGTAMSDFSLGYPGTPPTIRG